MNSADAVIVRVLGNGTVLKAGSSGILPATRVAPGDPGFYLAVWKPRRRTGDAPAGPSLFGPLASRSLAERLRTSAVYFGLVGDPAISNTRHASRARPARRSAAGSAAPGRPPQRRATDRNGGNRATA